MSALESPNAYLMMIVMSMKNALKIRREEIFAKKSVMHDLFAVEIRNVQPVNMLQNVSANKDISSMELVVHSWNVMMIRNVVRTRKAKTIAAKMSASQTINVERIRYAFRINIELVSFENFNLFTFFIDLISLQNVNAFLDIQVTPKPNATQ